MSRLHATALALLLPLAAHAQQDNPDYTEAFGLFKAGPPAEALRILDSHLATQPADARALLLKARILIDRTQYAEAGHILELARQADPQVREFHALMGEIAFRQQQWAEAFAHYRQHTDSPPASKDSILKMIYCLVAVENYAASLKLVATLDPADPVDPHYYFARAALAFRQGKNQDYENALRQARTIYGMELFQQFEPDLLFTLKHALTRPSENTPQ
jgi:tetratricopeptide (TPR) repeat protein